MLVPEALRYQTYKTCTLAFVGQMRQRRIWHKQSALCRQSEQSLPLAGSGVLYATMLIINTIISPTTELTSSSSPQVFNVSLLTGQSNLRGIANVGNVSEPAVIVSTSIRPMPNTTQRMLSTCITFYLTG